MNSLEGRRLKRQLEDAKECIRGGATIDAVMEVISVLEDVISNLVVYQPGEEE